jgi:SSS family solute:Na+ symporter
MHPIDYAEVGIFFLVMIAIGFASSRKIKSSKDFFVGGGKVPWWLAGVSLHVSGYSGVAFVALAAVAYRDGISLYVWWATPYVVAGFLGAFVFAPRWARLRIKLNIESPTEYLAARYSVPTQQLMAWGGVLLKLFDVGAKWAALGVLLHGFTGLPLATGILFSGGISLLYVTVGGIWADLYTDFAQYIVQLVAGSAMFLMAIRHLGGIGSVWGIWQQLPPSHSQAFTTTYSPWFLVGYVSAGVLSSTGGTWNQAARFIAAPSGKSAKKSALLCGVLYLIWPPLLFFPMWAGPLLVPNLADPTQLYPILALKYLPAGLVGLSLAAMFAATMSMTTSDTNTISAVITRDILPHLSARFREVDKKRLLQVARLSTFIFTVLTLVIALESENFGGVLGLIVAWFSALIGPISIPMLFGLLPAFRHADSRAAIGSIVTGLLFFASSVLMDANLAVRVGSPIFSSAAVYCLITWLNRKKPVPVHVSELLQGLSSGGEREAARIAATV